MKNVAKLIITSLLILSGFFNLSADTGALFSVTSTDGNLLVLNLEENREGETQVRIKDQNGFTIFTESLRAENGQTRKYNLKNLEAGNYTFQVDYNSIIKIQKVKKLYNGISLEGTEEVTVFKPSFIFENNAIALNFLAFKGMFEIEIIDSEGNVLHNELHQADGAFTGRYDLSELKSGSYTCRLYVDNKDFEDSFVKKFEVQTDVASF